MKKIFFILFSSLLMADTIIPFDERISDFETKIMLAQIVNNKEEALSILLNLKDEDIDDLQVRYLLAKTYFFLHKEDEAKKEFDYILLKDPKYKGIEIDEMIMDQIECSSVLNEEIYSKDINDLFMLAKEFKENREYERAKKIYFHLLEKKRKDPKIYEALGEIYLNQEKLADALYFFKKALKIRPTPLLKRKIADLYNWTENYSDGLKLYEELEKKEKDYELTVQIAKIYFALNDFEKAIMIIQNRLNEDPDNIDLLMGIADIQSYYGHSIEGKRIYQTLLKKQSERILLKYAIIMQCWGDFERAREIFFNYLKKNPDDLEIQFEMANVLVNMERYQEAERVYFKLAFDEKNITKSYYQLALCKMKENDYEEAVKYFSLVLKRDPTFQKTPLLLAKSLAKLNYIDEAIFIYNKLLSNLRYKKDALIGLTEIYLKMKNKDSLHYTLKLLKDQFPNDVQTLYLYSETQNIDFFNLNLSAKELTNLGDLFLEKRDFILAKECYSKSLLLDEIFFPAQLGLIRLFSAQRDYPSASQIINNLLKDFDEDYLLNLIEARNYGFDRQFKKSLDLYSHLRNQDCTNPLIIREIARVQSWNFDMDRAKSTYDLLLYPSVDQLLKERLDKDDPKLIIKTNKLYEEYEKLYDQKKDFSNNEINKVLIDLIAIYKIQKGSFLEKREKSLSYDYWYIHSINEQKKLIDFEKYNEEVLFDLAQNYCKLGLCNLSLESYQNLLDLDPLHQLAHIAYKRNQIESRPTLGSDWWFWEEFGRDQLDEIVRNRVNTILSVPFCCKNHLFFAQNYYLEHPIFNHKYYDADGFTLGGSWIFSQYFTTDFYLCKKYYRRSAFEDTLNGAVNFIFDFNDFFHLSLGFLKKDHLENYFGLLQKIQESNYKIGFYSDITHKFSVAIDSMLIHMSDHNDGQYHKVDLAYKVLQYPTILKIGAFGEYKDLKHQDIYVYLMDELINIIHPYWTPQHYKSIRATIDFYHDISKYLFCGEAKTFYGIKLFGGTDSENNNSFQGNLFFGCELKDRLIVRIEGMIHRSQLWRADNFYISLNFRF